MTTSPSPRPPLPPFRPRGRVPESSACRGRATPGTAWGNMQRGHLPAMKMSLERSRAKMTRHLVIVLAMLGLGLPAMAHAQSARAQLEDAQAKVVGTATLSEVPGGVRVSLRVNGLKAGEHGFHIHAVGRCEPPDFMSAGPHFNPYGKQTVWPIPTDPMREISRTSKSELMERAPSTRSTRW